MQIRLEVLKKDSVPYKDKKTGKDEIFEVLECREASPATVLRPFKLPARQFPAVKPGEVVTVAVTDFERERAALAVSIKAYQVNGAKG